MAEPCLQILTDEGSPIDAEEIISLSHPFNMISELSKGCTHSWLSSSPMLVILMTMALIDS